MGSRLEIPPYLPQIRWLVSPQFNTAVNSSQAATAGRVFLMQFTVTSPVIADQINIYNFATVDGNVTVGIYGPIVTDDTCAGAALKVESASTALSGASQFQAISITPTNLEPGTYYAAVEFSSATHTYGRCSNNIFGTSWTQFYDRSGGYGALTNPCPAVTNSTTTTATAPANFVLRCQT